MMLRGSSDLDDDENRNVNFIDTRKVAGLRDLEEFNPCGLEVI